MSKSSNFAAWLPGVGKELDLGSAEIPEPGEGEILIEVHRSTSLG